MAASWKSHRYLGGGADRLTTTAEIVDQFEFEFEFDEAEIWSTNDNVISINLPETKPRPLRKPVMRKSVGKVDDRFMTVVGPMSLPVSVPDWSKILGGECRKRAVDDYVEDDGGNDRMPPHEYLAKTRAASFSVHEGAGRTLKGRDLRRVRNAIWKQTGFED